MTDEDEESRRLRSAALKNVEGILKARQTAERALASAHETLEKRTSQLQEQREWFEVTLRSIGDAVITTDVRGAVTFLNPVAEEMTGWTSVEAQGQPLEAVFHIINEDSKIPVPNPIREVLQSGAVVGLANHTALIRRGSGETIAIEDSAAPIRDATGAVAGAVMVFHDVTQRRKAERALQASEEQLRTVFEQVPVGIALVELDASISHMNQRFCDILGYSRDELRQMNFTHFTHPDDLEMTRTLVDQLQGGKGSGYTCDKRYVRKDGTVVWSHTVVEMLRNEDGVAYQYIGIIDDITARRAAAEAIQKSAQRFQLALAAGSLSDWSWDIKSDLLDLGPRMRELLGLDPHAPVLADQIREFVAVPDGEGQRAAMQIALAERKPFVLEFQASRPGTPKAWFNARGQGVYGPEGALVGMIGVMQETTAQKEIELALSRLAALVESSEDAIISKDLTSVIQSWNPAAEAMFGYTAAEAIGRPITMLIPEGHLDEEPSILAKLRRGERIEHYETVRRRKDGSLLQVSLSVSPIRDAQGRVIGASKIARDITRQKMGEAALSEETRVLEVLNETGTAIAAQLDLESLVQNVTDAATELSGAQFGAFFYNVTNHEGESFLLYALSGAPREAFEKFGLPRNTPVFNPTFRGEGVVRSDDITKDPRYGQMEPHHGMPAGHLPVKSYLAVPVVSRSGETIGGLFFGHSDVAVFTERSERLVSGVAAQAAVAIDNARLYEAAQREIASRERAEAALRETDRRKDEFLATLAHELRNPLAPIRQAALISKAESATEAQKRWSHDVISRQVHHMALLLDDLLDISRITRGTLELRREMTDVVAVVDAAVETARPAIDAKRHTLITDLPKELVPFEADPLRLAQVLSNLLTNAAKYMDPGGQIHLSASRTNDTITISVTDTGIGLSRESLDAVFAMFSQVKSGHDRSEGGLGIGLALARGLVELHEGTIEARSAGVGKGSKFVVRLPLRSSKIARPAEAPGVPGAPTISRRILIADDNRDAAESLALLLTMEKHDVKVVHDGKEALAAFTSFQPEVALLDIGMPGLSGYEVARQVRQGSLGRAVTLIAVTGWGQDSDKAQALAAGFNHHFTKPIEPERLSALLRSETL